METTVTDRTWRDVATDPPPNGLVVEVPNNGGMKLKRSDRMWFLPDDSMYVYFTPTRWRLAEVPAQEAMRLAAEIKADRRQMEALDTTIGQLYEARRVVLERVQANESRHRTLTAAHYADFERQAREAS